MINKLDITILFILFNVFSFAQFGIIDDEEGYVNMRIEGSIDAEVIYKIEEFELFLFNPMELNQGDWIKVSVPLDKYSMSCNNHYIHGFVHTSRIKVLEDLEIYSGSNFHFQYALKSFESFDEIFKKVDDQYIQRIKDKCFYGTDGAIPSKQIVSIRVEVGEVLIPVPKVMFEDLFEVSNEFQVFSKEDHYFVQQWNSDGAGGYLLIWSIDSNGIQESMVFRP